MRKNFAILCVLLVTVGAACSQDKPPEAAGPLVVQVQGEVEAIAIYDAVVKAFMQEYPDIDVDLIKVTGEEDPLAKLASQFAGGKPPDVFLINFREYSQFAARGSLEPVGPLLEDAGVDFADYYSQPLDAFTFDGALQCMPQNISSMVVYYNTDLFKKSDVPRPPTGWSWADLRQAALDLTKGEVRGLGIEPQVIRLAPFVWSNGGEIVDDPQDPSRLTFDDPASREALEFIVSLVRDDKVVPTEEELAAQDLQTRFVTGKLGMFLSSRKDTPAFREVTGLHWDVAAPPVAEQPSSILHSDGYCVAEPSEQKEAAATFISFATGEEGQTLTALAGRVVPILKSVSRSAAFLDPSQPPAHSEVFLDNIPALRATPVIPAWAEIEALSEETMTKVFYEPGFSIDDGIVEFDEVLGPLFAEDD